MKEDAAEFESIAHAIRFAVETQLPADADLYIACPDPSEDFVIPLQKNPPPASPEQRLTR